ncbi:MAG TPA: FtsX-like permease family protein [Verrucomicrobiae bacterium]|jgi:putative ABC transport system permease protein
MTLAGFIAKNALRNKRRAALTVLSVAVSLFLFVMLLVTLHEFTVPPEDIGASLRIVVRNKVSLAAVLPVRQLTTIDKIPGIAAVTPFTWFGGRYKDEEYTMFAQFAVDPARFTNVFVEAHAAPEQIEAWKKNRLGCLVGKDTMEKYKLKVGDKLKLSSTINPMDVDLEIAAVYSGTLDDRNVFFHHKLLDEALNTGIVGTWWLRAESAEVASAVIDAINKAFANTSAEVRAETERAFQMGFVSMWGNIKILIGAICTVVVFTLLLVTVSTMSMAIRERFRELAVLKALGYRRRELFAFILAESFGLAMLGAVLGAGGAWLFFRTIDIQKLTNGIFVYFEVTPRILGTAFTVAAGLGIIAALPPSLAVARTTVVDGLRTLD